MAVGLMMGSMAFYISGRKSMLTTVRHIFGRIMHSETALCSQWDKGWKNNLLFASPSIRRPTPCGFGLPLIINTFMYIPPLLFFNIYSTLSTSLSILLSRQIFIKNIQDVACTSILFITHQFIRLYLLNPSLFSKRSRFLYFIGIRNLLIQKHFLNIMAKPYQIIIPLYAKKFIFSNSFACSIFFSY